MLGQVLHINLTVRCLTNLEAASRALHGINEQVLDALIINLKHTELHLELLGGTRVQLNAFENFVARDGNNTPVFAIANL